MKVRCPRCEKKLNIPDKYAGKAVRCPACNQAFNVPKLAVAVGAAGGRGGLDLEGLAALEAQTQQLSDEDRTALESAAAPGEALDPTVRICPHCGTKVKAANATVDILCSHCWKAIPGQGGGGFESKKKVANKTITATGAGGFYAELFSSLTYPLSAIHSLAAAALIAFGAAIVPVAVMTALANTMEMSNVGTVEGVKEADLSGVSMVLTMIFGAEVFFAAAVAIHAFFDVVRTTTIGDDAAPKLNFNPNAWAKSLGSYLALSAYLSVASYVVAFLTLDAEKAMAALESGDIQLLATESGFTKYIFGMCVVSFFIPMNLIGIALGNIGQGLNPARVAKSAARTHAHYIFLVLIVCVYGALFSFGFIAISFGWFFPKMEEMFAQSGEGKLVDVALALLAWGVVMASFFYGSYVIARLHGLFSRTFRKQLEFGTR